MVFSCEFCCELFKNSCSVEYSRKATSVNIAHIVTDDLNISGHHKVQYAINQQEVEASSLRISFLNLFLSKKIENTELSR